MRSRPFAIRLLSAFLILGPFVIALIGSHARGLGFFTYLREVFADRSYGPWECFVVPPAMGVFLYWMKKWSYLACGVCGVFVASHAIARIVSEHGGDRFWPLGAAVLSTAIFVYFFVPATHAVFFDPKMKWWESLPRYLVRFPVEIEHAGVRVPGTVLNASRGGLLVELPDAWAELEGRIPLTAKFRAPDEKAFALEVRVAHLRKSGRGFVGGLEFTNLSAADHADLGKFAARLKSAGYPRARPEPRFWGDLFTKIRGRFTGPT